MKTDKLFRLFISGIFFSVKHVQTEVLLLALKEFLNINNLSPMSPMPSS